MSESWRKVLLLSGLVSSVLYALLTALSPLLWPAYSSASQTISELSAIGAPTRRLWLILGSLYTPLVIAFGCGVRESSGSNRRARTVGWLIVAYGSLGLLWPFAPMHLREVVAAGGATFTDTLHIVLASITVPLMLAAVAVGAAAFGRRFRIYSVLSLMALGLGGAMTFLDAPRLAANLPTPWMGVWERINLGVFLLWVAALAAALWPVGVSTRLPAHRPVRFSAETRHERHERVDVRG